MVDATRPTWAPDWRDASKYPKANTTPEQWAWEFLRRNTEYQAAFAKWNTYSKERRYGMDGIQFSLPKDQALNDEYDTDCAKFSVGAFIDPSEPLGDSNVHGLGFRGGFPWYSYVLNGMKPSPITLHDKQAALIFRLDLPVKPQVARATRILTNLAKMAKLTSRARYNPRSFPLYLRVLDATAIDAKQAAIASELRKEPREIRRLKKTAEGLRDGGYRMILMTGTKRTLNLVR